MTWSREHSASERLAAQAEAALRHGDHPRARSLYEKAAIAESRAAHALEPAKARTLGITAVSATALWYKAGNFTEAERTACEWLGFPGLPTFAADELREAVQNVWSERARQSAGLRFIPGQLLISVRGGEVVPGGAPLDLILGKVEGIRNLFYRTAEFLGGIAHRNRGVPAKEIQDTCRPWLFQAAPGSYQFAVALEEPRQQEFWPSDRAPPRRIGETLLTILRATADDPVEALPQVVHDHHYRQTFLKLTRNLTPSGKVFSEIQVKDVGDIHPVTFRPQNRKAITLAIGRPTSPPPVETTPETVRGILRAVHLDKDWLEIHTDEGSIRVEGVGETVDDVIGPMVNRPVVAEVLRDSKGKFFLHDIETDE